MLLTQAQVSLRKVVVVSTMLSNHASSVTHVVCFTMEVSTELAKDVSAVQQSSTLVAAAPLHVNATPAAATAATSAQPNVEQLVQEAEAPVTTASIVNTSTDSISQGSSSALISATNSSQQDDAVVVPVVSGASPNEAAREIPFPQPGHKMTVVDMDKSKHNVVLVKPSLKKKSIISPLWKNLVMLDPPLPKSGKNVICICTENTQKTYCRTLLKYTNGSTSNLGSHFEQKHPSTNMENKTASAKSESRKQAHAGVALKAVLGTSGPFAKLGVRDRSGQSRTCSSQAGPRDQELPH